MESGMKFFAGALLFVLFCACSVPVFQCTHNQMHLGRHSFPPDFVFGLASSAYQYEGAANEDGKGKSIWDTFSHTPGKTVDGSNGDIAEDEYHRFKEHVKLMVDLGIDSYRLSISWPRIFPRGRGIVNEKGLAYYNNLIDELLNNGIEPLVTIFHWDLPQHLQHEYGGFLNRRIVDDFVFYANTCFEAFGDRVKKWVTINELFTISIYGYDYGSHAPGRCSKSIGNCSDGDSAREPYIVAHNLLLSHAAAVKLYREKYKKNQNGLIGITLFTDWFIPYTNDCSDEEATRRILDFYLGWFMDPLTKGEYPDRMITHVRDRLPQFTPNESEQVKGSFDFIGINYYSTVYAINNNATPSRIPIDFYDDSRVILTGVKDGVPIGPQSASTWLYSYPRGIRDFLIYMKEQYNNPRVYITENGFDEINNECMPRKDSLNDTWRITYVSEHLGNLSLAIREGCNVAGYYGWTLMDDFEWDRGYSIRFGFYFTDRYQNLTTYAKASAYWFKNFLRSDLGFISPSVIAS